jgi:NTE family protein
VIAFVLSGGASLGAIQAGMLEALFERGIEPDLIVGTSAGALNGAFVASRPATPGAARELAAVWAGIRRGDVFPLRPLAGLMGFLRRAAHLVPLDGLCRIVDEHLEAERLEDLPVPLHLVAADVASGAEIRLSSGPLRDAVLASAAIPGVFPPVEVAGRLLMDGGVANNTPMTHALELGADEVYVLPTGYACALPEPPRGALAMALHAMTLLVQQRLVGEIVALREHAASSSCRRRAR